MIPFFTNPLFDALNHLEYLHKRKKKVSHKIAKLRQEKKAIDADLVKTSEDIDELQKKGF